MINSLKSAIAARKVYYQAYTDLMGRYVEIFLAGPCCRYLKAIAIRIGKSLALYDIPSVFIAESERSGATEAVIPNRL